MSDNDNTPEPSGPPADGGGRRKWEKPRVQSGQLFETASLSCGKLPTDGVPICMQNPTTS